MHTHVFHRFMSTQINDDDNNNNMEIAISTQEAETPYIFQAYL